MVDAYLTESGATLTTEDGTALTNENSTGSTGGGTAPVTTTINYPASSAIIANQERGWFQYSETHYKSDNSGYTPLTASNLSSARTGTSTINGLTFPAMSLVFRYFYLEKYITIDTIDAAYLALLDADLAAVRAAGCKTVIRFAYTNSDSNDAPPARVRSHIAQLAPTINKYADVVHAVEAGFIGQWGEWYYTNNFGDQATVTAQSTSDRNSVISALLSNLNSSIFVLVRYVGSRQTYLNSTAPNPGGDATRIGFHNDAFTAPYGDYGTYTNFTTLSEAQNRAYVDAVVGVPAGGESAGYFSPSSDWANAGAEMASHKFSFLNPNYFQQVITNWGQTNVDTASRLLGPRLRLASAVVPTSAPGSTTTTWQLNIVNDGWQSPFRNRPLNIVLDDNAGHVYTYPASVDVRNFAPGSTTSVTVTGTAPAIASTYNTYVTMPDPASAISARPEYMTQLANTGMFDASSGRNSLSNQMVVTSAGTAPVGYTGIASLSGTGALVATGSTAVSSNKVGTASLSGTGTLTATATAYVPAGAGPYATGKFGQALFNTPFTVTETAPQGTWTIEGWFYYTPNGAQQEFFGWNSQNWVGVNSAGQIAGKFGNTSTTLTASAWHHVAVTYDAYNTADLFVDGVYVNEWGVNFEALTTAYLGGYSAGTTPWAGGIDEVRISSVRRYTGYGTITQPTTTFANDANTLGIYHLDGNTADATKMTIATGTAALAGAGTLSATTVARAVVTGSVALAGSGSLGVGTNVSANVTATLSGAGALSVGTRLTSGTVVAFTGAGVLAAAAVARISATGTATLFGSGALLASGVSLLTNNSTPTLSGAGALVVSSTANVLVPVSLTGAGALSTGATVTAARAVLFAGSGTLAASILAAPLSAVVFTGSGTVSSFGTQGANVTPAFAGNGTLSYSATTYTNGVATVALGGVGTLSTGIVANIGAGGNTRATVESIANLAARYRADSITGVADGAKIASWPDLGPNGIAAIQTNATNQPVFHAAGPSVLFNGTNNWMNAGISIGGNQQTVIAVVRRSNTNTAMTTIKGGTRNNDLEVGFANNVQQNNSFSVTGLGNGNTTVGTNLVVATTTFNNGPGSAFWINGASAGAVGAAAPGAGVDGSPSVIGGSTSNNGNTYDLFAGEIVELMWWSRILTAAERATVHSYVQDRYSIPVADYVAPPVGNAVPFNFSGTGSLVATVISKLSGATALSGSGTITTTSKAQFAQAVVLAGLGQLSTAGTSAVQTPVALTGAGTMVAASNVTASAAVAMSGLGSLSAAQRVMIATIAQLSGSGTLAINPKAAFAVAAPFISEGVLSVSGVPLMMARAQVALSGTGTLVYHRNRTMYDALIYQNHSVNKVYLGAQRVDAMYLNKLRLLLV